MARPHRLSSYGLYTPRNNKLRDTEAAPTTYVHNKRNPRPKNFGMKEETLRPVSIENTHPLSLSYCRLFRLPAPVSDLELIRMEVCVDSVVSAVNASRGGASRLELCVALSEGGLTPTPGLLEIVKSCVHIPVFVMLRPRPGADFVYSPEEARIIKCDAAVLKKHGADGFVFGALTASGLIDEILCKDIVEIVAPLPVTFHRAIDVVRNPVGSMETIIQLGFTRILTSGGERTAYAGLQIIRELMVASMGRITIVPASGINSDNLGPILEVTGAREFHVSGRVPLKISWNQSKCKMGTGDDDTIYLWKCCEKVEGKEKKETSGRDIITRGWPYQPCRPSCLRGQYDSHSTLTTISATIEIVMQCHEGCCPDVDYWH
uniref:Copper homeostasis protein cutC homolog n=1 Tax=Timema monikensis TaxID=170555 RepID=A0A7R9E1R4_9NEOP|nr:unnamed protein product [Timema monikensis]